MIGSDTRRCVQVIWVGLAVAAAGLQLARNAVQKSLKSVMNDWAVTWTRFVFGWPWVALVYGLGFGADSVQIPVQFWIYCTLGGVAQIGGTRCLMGCFSGRQFAVGITLTKLESILTALLAFLLFQDPLSGVGLSLILMGMLGVLMVSAGQQHVSLAQVWGAIRSPAALYGMASGVCFALASALFRQANLAVVSGDPFLRGIFTLLVVLSIQTLILTVMLGVFYPAEFGKVRRYWRRSSMVGILGVSASMGWFIAFGMTNAAYVKMVGQVDMVGALLLGYFVFKERVSRVEVMGMVLVVLVVALASVYL